MATCRCVMHKSYKTRLPLNAFLHSVLYVSSMKYGTQLPQSGFLAYTQDVHQSNRWLCRKVSQGFKYFFLKLTQTQR